MVRQPIDFPQFTSTNCWTKLSNAIYYSKSHKTRNPRSQQHLTKNQASKRDPESAIYHREGRKLGQQTRRCRGSEKQVSLLLLRPHHRRSAPRDSCGASVTFAPGIGSRYKHRAKVEKILGKTGFLRKTCCRCTSIPGKSSRRRAHPSGSLYVFFFSRSFPLRVVNHWNALNFQIKEGTPPGLRHTRILLMRALKKKGQNPNGSQTRRRRRKKEGYRNSRDGYTIGRRKNRLVRTANNKPRQQLLRRTVRNYSCRWSFIFGRTPDCLLSFFFPFFHIGMRELLFATVRACVCLINAGSRTLKQRLGFRKTDFRVYKREYPFFFFMDFGPFTYTTGDYVLAQSCGTNRSNGAGFFCWKKLCYS